MPFRTEHIEVPTTKAKKVLVAGADDRYVEIRSGALPGQNQAGLGYNFAVGGPELEKDPSGGLYCFDSTWSGEIEEGDELWVSIPDGPSPWTDRDIPLTVLVRSRKPEDKPEKED